MAGQRHHLGPVTLLEAREVPAVTLGAFPEQALPNDRPIYVPVTVTNSPAGEVAVTVATDGDALQASVVRGGRSVRFNVSGAGFSGAFTVRLFEETAPLAAGRIVELVESGFYNGKLFHRVVPNFVIQGGSPNGDGVGGSPLPDVIDEFDRRFTFASQGLVAMANAGDDNNDSQFFITEPVQAYGSRPQSLNFNHTIVGILTEGFDLYQSVRNTPLNVERPVTDVVITSAEVFEDRENAVIQLTRTAEFSGSGSVKVSARDADGEVTEAFAVTGVDDATNSRAFFGRVSDLVSVGGERITAQLPGTDIDGDALTYTISDTDVAANANRAALSIDAATGVVTVTPVAGFFGVVSFRVGVRDQRDRTGGGLSAAANFDTQTVRVLIAPRVTLTAAPQPVAPGGSVTLTATVSGPANPAGTVDFLEGANVLGSATVVNGVATFTTSFAAAGTRNVIARLTSTDTTVPVAASATLAVTVESPVTSPPPPISPPPVPPVPPALTPAAGFRATGAAAGEAPLVTVRDAAGNVVRTFAAFEAGFTGGVRVVVADVTGDGVADIVAVPGPGGGAFVKVFSAEGVELFSRQVYEDSYRGGLNVAAFDLTAQGYAEVILGAEAGGAPRVVVLDVARGRTRLDYFAGDPNSRDGVRVAGTDLRPGARTQLLAVSGSNSAAPVLSIADGRTLAPLGDFPARVDPASTQPAPAEVSMRSFMGSSRAATTTAASTLTGPIDVSVGAVNPLLNLRTVTLTQAGVTRQVDTLAEIDSSLL